MSFDLCSGGDIADAELDVSRNTEAAATASSPVLRAKSPMSTNPLPGDWYVIAGFRLRTDETELDTSIVSSERERCEMRAKQDGCAYRVGCKPARSGYAPQRRRGLPSFPLKAPGPRLSQIRFP